MTTKKDFVIKKFPKEEMMELLCMIRGDVREEWKLISDEIIDHTRWSVVHEIIFMYNDKYYSTTYQVGATESQDETPWEYEDVVTCYEVTPEEKTVTVYKNIEA